MSALPFHRWMVAALALAVALMLALPLRAQTILRDAEMERALRELARPVIAAAGLSPSQISIAVIKDDRMNAFVVDGRTVFLHSGLLLRMSRPEMVQAVIAHEVAHIANGHLTRRAANARSARSAMLFGLALAAAVSAVEPGAAAGVALGTQSAAQRRFFAHTRAEEAAADQAAVRYMARADIDPSSMVEVLDLFRGQEALSPGRQDLYVRTHPFSRDRMRALKGFVAAYGGGNTATTANAQYWFARSKAKLSAYLRNPSWSLRRIKKNDTSDAALVGRAVAYHQKADAQNAIANVDRLIAKRPNDPYAHELKGWILLESRGFNAAVGSYAQALQLAPKEPLIRAGYGRALLATDTAANNAKALSVLKDAKARDPYNPSLLRDLAVAYARAGDKGNASLATAERYAMTGKLKDAAIHAKRASDLLPRGSTGWRRAEDILAAAETQKKRKKR